MKIAVTGANGQLGSDICEVLRKENHEVIELNHDEFDIINYEFVSALLKELKPEVVINPAAYHHVEKCQNDPDMAFSVNATAPFNMAKVCKEINAMFIHISTDYVFDGEKNAPYLETDCATPLNNYGISKLAGEQMITTTNCRHLIIRTSGLYGINPCRAKGGKNFVELMMSLAEAGKPIRVVDDEKVSPTFTLDLARQISKLLTVKDSGICHATAEGDCSWYEFAKSIFEIANVNANLSKVDPGEFAIKVNRPKYSVLENHFLKTRNLNVMKHWKESLREYLSLRKNNL
ncbi:MAG: dTDP-4-dehydrorhamnose reductase [Bacteroidia bacterium]